MRCVGVLCACVGEGIHISTRERLYSGLHSPTSGADVLIGSETDRQTDSDSDSDSEVYENVRLFIRSRTRTGPCTSHQCTHGWTEGPTGGRKDVLISDMTHTQHDMTRLTKQHSQGGYICRPADHCHARNTMDRIALWWDAAGLCVCVCTLPHTHTLARHGVTSRKCVCLSGCVCLLMALLSPPLCLSACKKGT